MSIIATCPKCHSDRLTLPNLYRERWQCISCGAKFLKPKMARQPISQEAMLELKRQFAEAMQEAMQETHAKEEQHVRGSSK